MILPSIIVRCQNCGAVYQVPLHGSRRRRSRLVLFVNRADLVVLYYWQAAHVGPFHEIHLTA